MLVKLHLTQEPSLKMTTILGGVSMPRLQVAVLTVLLLQGFVANSDAAVEDFFVDHTPVLLGDQATFYGTNKAPFEPILSVKWEGRAIAKSGALGNWADFNVNQLSMTRNMNRVDQLEIRLTVKYQSIMGMPAHADSVIQHTVTVQRPTVDVVSAGTLTPTPQSPDGSIRVQVVFDMKVGGTNMGPHALGYVQEQITDPAVRKCIGIWESGLDSDWKPPAGVSDPVYYMAGFKIIDLKSSFHEEFDCFSAGTAIMRFTQQNRLVTQNYASEEVIIEFPKHRFERRKYDSYRWSLVEVPLP
jgi:hypothetical protein